jgi:hypothetical protein
MNIKDVASRIFARIAGMSSKMEEANGTTRRGPLSLSFTAGTWNLGYDVDSFIALSEGGEMSDGDDSQPKCQ